MADNCTKIVYASFDRFPSSKGAATHINAFIRALGRRFKNVHLVTIPSESRERMPDSSGNVRDATQRAPIEQAVSDDWAAPGVERHPIPAVGVNLFERVLSFRAGFSQWWLRQFGAQRASVIHFRSIFEGYPVARDKEKLCDHLIYEVNGLPSIELKYHYPAVASDRELLTKLETQEQVCLEAADKIITVSDVNAAHLVSRGVPPDRITVIRNGVNTELFRPRGAPFAFDERHIRLLYAGTISPWQGAKHAIEALALLRRDYSAELTMVGPIRPRQRKGIEKLIWDQGIADHVHILEPVSQADLLSLQHSADVILAPLTKSDRNTVQGCCPLKVLEAMASGTPLVASDLPVVRELASDNEAVLVRPGSGKAIKDGILRFIREPELAAQVADSARNRVAAQFTWKRACETLVDTYESLLARE